MISTDLPEVCYVYEPTSHPGGVCAIKKGKKGYFAVKDYPNGNQDLVDRLNAKLSVTVAQVKAMHAGSMFGWHLPVADPKTYEGK